MDDIEYAEQHERAQANARAKASQAVTTFANDWSAAEARVGITMHRPEYWRKMPLAACRAGLSSNHAKGVIDQAAYLVSKGEMAPMRAHRYVAATLRKIAEQRAAAAVLEDAARAERAERYERSRAEAEASA